MNMWGAAWIAMKAPRRLARELDLLKAAGVTCLRIVAASEGDDDAPLTVSPTLQPKPGKWNEALARGMDLVLFELRKRRMRAIMTLSNQWSWSGGFATFLVWARKGHWRDIPYPASDLHGYWDQRRARGGEAALPRRQSATWDEYQHWATSFYTDPTALNFFYDTIRWVLTRENTYASGSGGYTYAEDATILAWELANEPRAVSNDQNGARAAYLRWVTRSAGLIKKLAPKQLVTVGSEGVTPFESYINTDFDATHRVDAVDLVTIHVSASLRECNALSTALAEGRRALPQ